MIVVDDERLGRSMTVCYALSATAPVTHTVGLVRRKTIRNPSDQ
jgi:hypothetical protein